MAINAGPKIVEDGLVFCVDAANKRSYPGAGTTWTDLSKQENNGTLTNKRNNRLKNRVFQIVKDQLLGEFWTSKKIDRLNKSIKNINNTNDSPSKIAKMMIDEKK